MAIVISTLTPADADAVDELMKDNNQTLGFLPRQAIDSFLRDDGTEHVLGAKIPDGQLVGYMIYAAYPDRFRIAHLCVSTDFRGHGIARRFIETLKQNATTQKDMRLHCRRDYPANAMWPKNSASSLSAKSPEDPRPLTFSPFGVAPWPRTTSWISSG